MFKRKANEPREEMTLTERPDGTLRITELRIGELSKRYWDRDEEGAIVWHPYPEPFTVPDGVSVVGRLLCPILGEIVLSPSVRRLDDLAFGTEFYGTDTYEWYALHTVHFSTGLEEIGYRAFASCRELDGVHLPKGLREIGEAAFRLCLSLSRITIPESVTDIGPRAFSRCPALTEVIFRGETVALAGEVFAEDTGLSRVILPKGLTAIPYACFRGCTALAEIALPEGLTRLGAAAFAGCSSLTSLHLSSDLEDAEELRRESPFEGCTSLTEISLGNGVMHPERIPAAPAVTAFRVGRDHPFLRAIDGALYSRDKKMLLRVPGGATGLFEIPRGVTAIAPYAFSGCHRITDVELPSSLRTIGKGAFLDCTALRSLELPGNVTDLGDRALAGCTALTHLRIPGRLHHIGSGAFDGANAIRTVTVSPENRHFRAEGARIVPIT